MRPPRPVQSLVFGAALATALAGGAWPADDYVRGLQALALLQTLNADLLSHDSATAVLQNWCDAHGRGGVKVLAERVRGPDRPPTDAARAALSLENGQAVRYRRVRLTCGPEVLSEADNWYLPGRLTADMNQTLDSSDTPFGVAVRALGFHRRTLSAELLYRPMPPDWEKGPEAVPPPAPIPHEVLRHSAVLSTPQGAPFSFVVETYTGAALQMAMPR